MVIKSSGYTCVVLEEGASIGIQTNFYKGAERSLPNKLFDSAQKTAVLNYFAQLSPSSNTNKPIAMGQIISLSQAALLHALLRSTVC